MAVSFDPQSFAAPLQQTAKQATQQAAQRTWNKVPAGTKEAVNQRLQQSGDSLRGAKTQLSEQVSQRSEQARQGAEGMGDRLSQFLGDKLHHVQGWFSQPVQHWLDEHRVIAWATAHPFIAAIGLVLLAILSLNLLKALLNPRNWLKIFSVPLQLAKLGLGTDDESLYFEQTLQPGDIRQGEVKAILGRLEALNKEQELLHQQLKSLLGTEASKTKL